MDYVNEEEIFAFIHVIKSDNAGGVSRDRVSNCSVIVYAVSLCFAPSDSNVEDCMYTLWTCLQLQRVLKTLSNKQGSKQSLPFDPRCAIFVCNRWDLVEKDAEAVGPDEEDRVKDTIKEKLAGCWPDIDTSQIFHMSALKAWNTLEATGYVTEDLARLLDGIEKLVPIGLLRKIQMHHTWVTLTGQD